MHAHDTLIILLFKFNSIVLHYAQVSMRRWIFNVIKCKFKRIYSGAFLWTCVNAKRGGNVFGLQPCVPAYLRTSILMKARCVDAEWQPKRRESCRQQKSGARMTVAEMKGDSWEERPRHVIARCAARFPTSASWMISPGKQRGYWEKERGGAVHNEVCTGRETADAFLCQGMAEIQSTAAGSEGLWKKKKKHKCLASEWLRWRGEAI